MKKLKCIISIVLGSLLGFIASCAHLNGKVETAPEADKPVKHKIDGVQMPKKSEDLPVRRPIME